MTDDDAELAAVLDGCLREIADGLAGADAHMRAARQTQQLLADAQRVVNEMTPAERLRAKLRAKLEEEP